MTSPAEMGPVLFFVIAGSILAREWLRQQSLGLCDASSEQNISFLVVFFCGRIGTDGSDVVLNVAEVADDFDNTHCAGVINCRTTWLVSAGIIDLVYEDDERPSAIAAAGFGLMFRKAGRARS